MRRLALLVSLWMAAMLGVGLWLGAGGDGQRSAAPPVSAPAPADGQRPVRDYDPAAAGVQDINGQDVAPLPQTDPVPGPDVADEQIADLVLGGWPALARLPYSSGGVQVRYAGVGEGAVVLNVFYRGSEAQARARVRTFLRSAGDRPERYLLRLFSRAELAARKREEERVEAAFRGHYAPTYLPRTRGRTTLDYLATKKGRVVLIARYRGAPRAARADVRAILAELGERPAEYEIVYRRAGR
jgi:hypothetical protein